MRRDIKYKLLGVVGLSLGLLAGCGGGGSDPGTSAASTSSNTASSGTTATSGSSTSTSTSTTSGSPTLAVNYAGTYVCTLDDVPGVVVTATLTAASGDFSSCSGVTASGYAQACSGSISAQGELKASANASNGTAQTYDGTVNGSTVTGNYWAIYNGGSTTRTGTFTCARS